MIKGLPDFISWLFILTVIITALFFIAAAKRGNSVKSGYLVAAVLGFWVLSQSFVSIMDFYTDTKAMPPKLLFLVTPPYLLMLLLFITKSGRHFIDSLSLPLLTQLHVVRAFVEVILYWLFIYNLIPQLMTFEGRNFDILAGITAPLMAFMVFVRKSWGRNALLAWNIIGLMLVLNIMINGILSVPFPFQKFAFDQPNTAVLYFPFTLLPGFIVPIVIFAHLVAIRRLLNPAYKLVKQGSASEAELVN